MSEQPTNTNTVITANQWYAVATAVEDGRCEVWAELEDCFVVVERIEPVEENRYLVTDVRGIQFTTFPEREFTVRWREPAATAQPSEAAGEDDTNAAIAEYILKQAELDTHMPMYKEYRESVDNQCATSYGAFMGFKHWLASSLSWEIEKTNFLMKKRQELEAENARLRDELAAARQREAAALEALKPFADAYKNVTELDDDDDVVDEHMQQRYKVGVITARHLLLAKLASDGAEG